MQRTPYGVDETNRASFFAQRPELARDGYIYVGEDIRGRYKSEGKFVMMRPLADHHDSKPQEPSTKAPTPTTPWPGCSKTCPATTAAPASSAPAIPAFWP